MSYFVFLEFLDPIVELTLRQLRDALQPWKLSKSPVHVSVTGPYKHEPDLKTLQALGTHLQYQGVRIFGHGVYANKERFSVFLRAESAVFKEIWWKPDFDTSLERSKPHLTMFESDDESSARTALIFLRLAKVSILTHAVQLGVYSRGSPDHIETKKSVGKIQYHSSSAIVDIDPEVISEAYVVGEELRQRRLELIASRRTDA